MTYPIIQRELTIHLHNKNWYLRPIEDEEKILGPVDYGWHRFNPQAGITIPLSNHSIFYRIHAVQRMFERKIAVSRVSRTVRSGETIEDFSAEMPQPGRLILGFQGKRPLHVVVSEDANAGEITVITVYIPDLDRWDRQFKSRRP